MRSIIKKLSSDGEKYREEHARDLKHRDLVYFVCMPFHEKYNLHLRLVLEFMKLHYTGEETFDILVLTNEAFKAEIMRTVSVFPFNIHVHALSCSSVLGSGYCARFQVFEWSPIWRYDRAIYLDTDIVIFRPLDDLFKMMDGPSTLFLCPVGPVCYVNHADNRAGKFTLENFGGMFFEASASSVDPHDYRPVNSGQIGFFIDRKTKRLFSKLHNWMSDTWDAWAKTVGSRIRPV